MIAVSLSLYASDVPQGFINEVEEKRASGRLGPSPEDTTSALGWLTFSWVTPIIELGESSSCFVARVEIELGKAYPFSFPLPLLLFVKKATPDTSRKEKFSLFRLPKQLPVSSVLSISWDADDEG